MCSNRLMPPVVPSVVVVLLSSATAPPALAWHGEGHRRATRLAVASLPDDVPVFFRTGAVAVAHCSLDPDAFTRPIGPDDLHRTEAPQHYFDLERLGDTPIPARRYDLLMWCGKRDIHPSKVGLAPYAIVEWTQRLSVALAEHRRWPDSPHITNKALVYAGILAHYAEDLCMPLHTTIHYDGRLKPDGSSPRSGIHHKVDALLGKLPTNVALRIDARAVQPFEALLPAVINQLQASHALVDRVYQLERQLPDLDKPLPRDGPVAAFAVERLKASATFAARLMLTAWRDSARITLPEWHQRNEDAPVPGLPAAKPTRPAPPGARAR